MSYTCIIGAASGNWQIAGGIFFGIFLGALLAAAGFTDGNRVKSAFSLADKTLVLTFLSALFFGILLTQFAAFSGWITLPKTLSGFLWRSLIGGALCGIGLSLSGLGPFSALGSLATGKLATIGAIAGMILAIYLFRFWSCDLNAMLTKWDTHLGAVPMSMDFFSAANPALWFSAGLLIVIAIIQFSAKGK